MQQDQVEIAANSSERDAKGISVPTKDILYYPSIEIIDEGWLKSALLYWDCVYRIVPNGYQPNDNRAVQEAVDAGLIRNVVPEDEDRKVAAETFLQIIHELGPNGLPAGFEGDEYTSVHEDKIDRTLYPLLDKLAVAHKNSWITLSKPLARGYMLQLATVIARNRNLGLGTDNSGTWAMSSYLLGDANFDDSSPYFNASLSWRDMIPTNVKDVPMSEILKFVGQNRERKKALQDQISDFSNELVKCRSESHVQDLITRYKESLPDTKRAYRSGMWFSATGVPGSVLTQGIPVFLTSIGTLLAVDSTHPAHTLSTSFLIGMVATFADALKAERTAKRENPDSYLIDASNLGTSRIYRFDAIMDEFIND
jgi:hypothetical protein